LSKQASRRGDVLLLDHAAQLRAGRRTLETEVEIGCEREIVANREDVISLGFARRGVEELPGERGRRVDLKVEADRWVEKLDEQLGASRRTEPRGRRRDRIWGLHSRRSAKECGWNRNR